MKKPVITRLKKILHVILWIFLVSGFFAVVGFVEIEQKKLTCKNLRINIDYRDSEVFILPREVEQTINGIFGDSLPGKRMRDISISEIRQTLGKNPYIAKLTVYATVDGSIKVNVTQRKAILRVMNLTGQSFYITDDARMVPVSMKYSARVPVATGNIKESFDEERVLAPGSIDWHNADLVLTTLQKLYLISKYISTDSFLTAFTDQIFVNNYDELEIIPVTSGHQIIFGGISNIPEKFDKLITFYKEGLRTNGWSKYKTINIKYNNQVICSKN